MKFISIILFVGFSIPAIANDNSCDDYLSRHRRKDLVAKSAYFFNRNGHQAVKLKLRNRGEVGFSPVSTDENNYRDLYIEVDGREYFTKFRIPLASSKETTVILKLPADTLTHCGTAEFNVDTRRTAKQWGCRVWNNDLKELQTIQAGKICP